MPSEVFSRNEHIRALFENALDAVVGMNADGLVIDWNKQAEAIFGWNKTDVIGKRMSDTIIPVRFREAHENGLKRFFKSGKGPVLNNRLELSALHKNGREFPIELTVTPIHADGTWAFYAFLRDITERKQFERDLKDAKEIAEASNRAKTAFLANMSHEIRTPLGAVVGFSELLASENITAQEKEDYLRTIHKNSETLTNVINDILDLSKIESEKIQLDIVSVNVQELLSDVTMPLRKLAEQKGLKFELTIRGDFPPVIRTDPFRLKQILTNLLGNAIKFTQTGSVSLVVQGRKNLLEFTVTDTGIGINEEQAQQLFQPFSQADSSLVRKYGGTGLGLVLSRKLAQLLGGTVTLSSPGEGQGSTFTATIEMIAAPEEYLPEKTRNNISSYRLENLEILLVEDSPDNQILVKKFLSVVGANVTVVSDGEAAIDQTKKHVYDVILMDLQMPKMDGFKATRILRSQGIKTPIIALTAHAMKDERTRCLQSGFDEHIAKPIDRDLLIERIAEIRQAN